MLVPTTVAAVLVDLIERIILLIKKTLLSRAAFQKEEMVGRVLRIT